jgi:hypothetical protein
MIDATAAANVREARSSATVASRSPSLLRFLGALLTAIIVLAVAESVSARKGMDPISRRKAARPLSSIAVVALPGVDVSARIAADRTAQPPGPVRFAVPQEVNLTPSTHGTWEELANGGRLWRLQVFSAGATDLNIGFTRYWLPPGATLHILSEEGSYFEGPYTDGDNKPHGQLWTPVVPGERAVIELYVPPEATAQPDLVLGRIGLGYRDLFGRRTSRDTKVGSCNVDVICPEADAWRADARSVGGYSTGGAIFCTGTLIMDVPGSLRPFFLTASHCGVDQFNASSVVVYWNFESPSCGGLCCGSLADNQTGATFLASEFDVDFALVELDSAPDPAFQVCYAGWDRSGASPSASVSIHHPSGEEKAVSFNDDPLTVSGDCSWSCVHNKCATGVALDSSCDPCVSDVCIVNPLCCILRWDSLCVNRVASVCGPLCDTHWIVDGWESGTTEVGSSGGGLWDEDTHKLVGFLTGGESSCADPTRPDCYGRFSVAWDRGSSASQRLCDWLDPDDTAAVTVSGSCGPGPTPTPTPTPTATATPTPTPVPTPTPELDKRERACINTMNKNGQKVDRAQIKENEKCLKDHQKGKLGPMSVEACTTADRKGKVQKERDKTVRGEEKKCDRLPVPPPFGYTDSATVNDAAVAGPLALIHAIFGDPIGDADLFTDAVNKDAASCQKEMLERAGQLEDTVLKQINKAKKKAIKQPAVDDAAALEAALTAVLSSNGKIQKQEDQLVQEIDSQCSALQAPPSTVFPGACADDALANVENCVIAAARCLACSEINAFDALALDCDQADDRNTNGSCLPAVP